MWTTGVTRAGCSTANCILRHALAVATRPSDSLTQRRYYNELPKIAFPHLPLSNKTWPLTMSFSSMLLVPKSYASHSTRGAHLARCPVENAWCGPLDCWLHATGLTVCSRHSHWSEGYILLVSSRPLLSSPVRPLARCYCCC